MASQQETESLQRKREFYEGLSSIEEDEDGLPDVSLQASRAKLKQPVCYLKDTEARVEGRSRKRQAQTASHSSGRDTLPRSASDTNLAIKSRVSNAAQATSSTKDRVKPPPPLVTRHTFSGAPPSSSSAAALVTGKRKRDSTFILAPEDQLIFQGLHFYFFPNNEKHPARMMRITKAIEFGATWHREWHDQITHVIVDKSMNFALLLKFLKFEGVPAHVALVNETWPSESIAYRAILDTKQHKFKVQGAPQETVNTSALQVPASSTESVASLKLKAADRAVMTHEPETPDSGVRDSFQPEPPSDFAERTDIPEDQIKAADVSGSGEGSDALVIAIEQARKLQAMPLDDEDAESRPGSSGGLNFATEGRNHRKLQTLEDKFQCMQKHTGEASNNPNAPTIAILQQMADYYGQIGDEWRVRAYRKAMATLRNHEFKVTTRENALALPNIGERLATKIEEIAFTSRLRRLDNARAEPSDQILQTFMKIYGAGFVQASQWVREGYTTLDVLLAKAKLTDNQRIGIDHFEDFQTRIPRAEVEQHGTFVRKTLQRIDSAFEVTIGGSYRRGATSSGDIDCIISRPDTGIDHIRSVVLERLVPTLLQKGFLTATLAATSKDDGTKWHGASCLPDHRIWRRIDLLLVPSDEMGAALMYFTGNDIFNRSLRLLASTKGMRLNQRGLYKDVIRGQGREKLTEGTLVEGKDEKRIFEVLGVPYRPPHHRIP